MTSNIINNPLMELGS